MFTENIFESQTGESAGCRNVRVIGKRERSHSVVLRLR